MRCKVNTISINRYRLAAVVAICLVAVSTPASATMLFLNRTSWQAATIGSTILDFEGLPDPSLLFTQYSQPPGLTLLGVTFTSPSTPPDNPADLYAIDPGFDPIYDWGSGAILDAQFGFPTQIMATLPASITSLGFELLSPGAINPPDFLISLSSGESFLVSTGAQPLRTFVGLTSSVPIAWVMVTPQLSGSDAALDNFAFGTAAVPEPATGAVVGLALVFLICVHRRLILSKTY